jgi:AcrR family transcriptional regulator
MKSAMISYYFGDKESLFIKLLEKLADQQFEEFQNVLNAQNPIKAFINKAVAYFAKNTAITRLIADEILLQDSALATRFIDLFPKRLAILLPKIISNQQQNGLFESHVNPRWAAFSLMTLIIMPFIGAKVRITAWEISDQVVSSDAWAEHIYLLFISGVQQPAQLSE